MKTAKNCVHSRLTCGISGELLMLKVEKNEHGTSLVELVISTSLLFVVITVGFITLPTLIGSATYMQTWAKASSTIEDQCNLTDVTIKTDTATPQGDVKFTSSSNVSSEYTLKARGVNLIVDENGRKLCEAKTDLQDFR